MTIIKSKIERDILWNDIPCIFKNGEYIVFSPYSRKVVCLSEEQLNSNNIFKTLQAYNFFQSPSRQVTQPETVRISLVVTTDCNLRCKYCYAEAGDKCEYMTPQLAVRAIKEMIKPTTKRIHLTFFGGEPTLNMETIREAINYVEQLNLEHYYHLSTNGIVSDETLNYLIDKGFTINFSMDGFPEVHDRLRVFPQDKPSSKRVEETLKKLVQGKAHFKVRATITNCNVGTMVDSVKFWATLGVKFVHFEPINIAGRATQNEMSLPEVDVYVSNFIKALDMAEKCGIGIINSAYMNLLNPSIHYCTTVAGDKFIFSPDGAVTLCYEVQSCGHPLQDFVVGRYNQQSDIFEIDKGKFQGMCSLSVESYKECTNCFAKYLCSGGCPNRNFIGTGSLTKVNPWICAVKKCLIRDAILRIYQASVRKERGSILEGNLFDYK